jgi:mevalonate kinase
MARAFEGRAPAKLILLGEHFVVYDRPALVLAGGPEARVLAEPHHEDRLVSMALGLDVRLDDATPPEARPFSLLLSSLRREATKREGIRLTVLSSIPVGQGLGSSGAVLVAAAGAASRALGLELSRRELAAHALAAEQLVHGRSSGVDVYAPLYGGLFTYRREKGLLEREEGHELPLLLALSGVPRRTGEVVARVTRWREEHGQLFERLADQVGGWALEALRLIRQGELAQLGALMTLNHCLLSLLGASHPRLDALVEASLRHGALGAKLSGGGGGGAAAVLARRGHEDELCASLRGEGFEAERFRPSWRGLSVIEAA